MILHGAHLIRIGLVALPTLIAFLSLAVAPARATLLIRSDGNGLFVQDKNNLDDDLEIGTGDHFGDPGNYALRNRNGFDFDKFDTQFGCRQGSTNFDEHASCFRNGPQMNILLGEGRDLLSMRSTNGANGPVISEAPIGESHVAGGAGNDNLNGHAGVDHINGGLGNDILRGSLGSDDLDGAENADRLEGGTGNDTLRGEGNADTLIGDKGADVLRGGAGNDFINSREPDGSTAVADGVDCGNGTDTVEADLKDNIQADCNNVDRAPVGETPNVDILGKTLRVSRTGRVKVRMRCPRGVKRLGCKGRLQLRIDRRGAGSSRSRKVRYRIKAGRRKSVTLQLTRRDVRSIRRRGRRARGVLTSVEKGRKGRKTTIRNPRLKLR
jgi:hypothetical protein